MKLQFDLFLEPFKKRGAAKLSSSPKTADMRHTRATACVCRVFPAVWRGTAAVVLRPRRYLAPTAATYVTFSETD